MMAHQSAQGWHSAVMGRKYSIDPEALGEKIHRILALENHLI